MEWFKENKKTVAVVAALTAALGVGAYFLAKEEEVTEAGQDKQNEQAQVSVTSKQMSGTSAKEYGEKLKEIVSKIQVVKDAQNPQCIDFQTIAKILESSVEVCQEDYVAMTVNQRKERRGKDGENYEAVIIEQCDQVETLLTKVQEEIIQALEIDQQVFEASLMLIIQRGLHQQLIYLDMAVKQQLKMKLESNKELDLEKAKDVIRFQNDIIEKEPQYFTRILQRIVANPEMQQKLPSIINIMLCDKVYEKYSIEEEDIVKMLGPYAQSDQEIQSLMIKAEEGMRQLLMSVAPPPGMGGMQGMM